MTATIETEQPQRAEQGNELDDANSNDLEAIDEPENLDGDDDPLDRIRFPKSLLKRVIKERMKGEVSSVQVRALPGWNVRTDRRRLARSLDAALDERCSRQISKNCLEAFDEAAKLFIHYLTWSAGEELRKSKRMTVGVEDVLAGLEEAEFGEMVAPLREYISGLQAGKKKGGGGGGGGGAGKKQRVTVEGGEVAGGKAVEKEDQVQGEEKQGGDQENETQDEKKALIDRGED